MCWRARRGLSDASGRGVGATLDVPVSPRGPKVVVASGGRLGQTETRPHLLEGVGRDVGGEIMKNRFIRRAQGRTHIITQGPEAPF